MTLDVNFYCDKKYKNLVPEPFPAAKKFPKWFSELSNQRGKFKYKCKEDNPYDLVPANVSIKKCLGVTEFLNTGYVIPSWADFIFREQDDGSLYINWMENYYDLTSYTSHGESQYPTMPNKPLYGHYSKIVTPWNIKTSPGVSVMITHPTGYRNNSFTSSTGIIHTDKTPISLAWFFEWNYKIKSGMDIDTMDVSSQVVAKGEPILLIIPFYRKNFKSKINYIDEEEYENQLQTHLNLSRPNVYGECPYKNFRKTFGKLFS